MREIKFRAWDRKNKKFIKNNIDYDKCEYYGNIFVCFKCALSDCLEDYILMQYTGLKDKNGKEIYEGDILELKNAKISFIPRVIFVMAWDDTRTGWTLYSPKDEFEVIGNIYENPELLKES
jgi:uncharacterized phage protein (TIGR01671 family)